MTAGSPSFVPLNDDQWERVQTLFHRAVVLSPAERAAFLESACGSDVRLRQEVSILLDADAGVSVLPSSLPQALSTRLDARDAVGRTIGAYRLDAVIGVGGFGAVYRASRSDEAFEKQVAIKLLKRGMDTDAILERFRNERQVLARLEHPNIARLLDGGATPDGLPYLVLEHVEGTPINAFCAARELDTRARLTLVRVVCDAVQSAHQQLVVHRDLKPSNVLVRDDGVVKLLDFGIAKVLAGPDEDGLQTMTAEADQALTLPYASPEQLVGDPVTVASDVYSLGVVLYELLSERRPFQESEQTRDKLKHAVATREPPSASRVAPSHRSADLGGDLDVMLATALQRDATRRYPTVSALSEDIQNYLDRRPLRARPPARLYRLRKFVARNALGVATAATIVVLLAGWTTTTSWQSRRLERERNAAIEARNDAVAAEQDAVAAENDARTQALKAGQFSGFLQDILLSITPESARGADTALLREVLKDADQRVDRLEALPDVRAQIRVTIGTVYRSLADYDAAERNLREALTIQQSLEPRPHGGVALAAGELMSVLRERGQLDEAAAMADLTLKSIRAAEGPSSRNAMAALSNVGLMALERGRFADAERTFREVIALAESDEHRTAYHNLGLALKRQGRYRESRSAYEEALKLGIDLFGVDHPDTALTYSNLALLDEELEDTEAAREHYEQALHIQQRVFPGPHPDLATTMDNFARFLAEEGECGRALELSAGALTMFRTLFGENNLDVAFCLAIGADVLRQCDQTEQAVIQGRQALALAERVAGPDSLPTAIIASRLAAVLHDHGDTVGSRQLLERAHGIASRRFGPDHPRTVGIAERLAALGGPAE